MTGQVREKAITEAEEAMRRSKAWTIGCLVVFGLMALLGGTICDPGESVNYSPKGQYKQAERDFRASPMDSRSLEKLMKADQKFREKDPLEYYMGD